MGEGKKDRLSAGFDGSVKLQQNLLTTASQTPGSPAEFDALVALAQREQSAGRLAEAAAVYRKILVLRPDIAEAYNNLGNVLQDQGKLDEAAAQYERAVALKPGLFQTHNNLGNIFRAQGKLEQAVARYEQALALRPDLAEAYNNLGNVLKQQGKFDEAAARYEQALALRPDYAEAHYSRTDLKTFRPGDPDLAALEALAADTKGLPPGKLLFIHFALGKALEDVGDYRRAFEHLLQGNALKRREVDYNEAAHRQTFRLTVDLFDSRLFDRFQGAGDPSSAPIFVVGMPRSGSTLVEQILASHPQVHAAGELKNLDRLVKTVSDSDGRPVPFPACISVLDADGLRRLGQVYLASLPTLPDGKLRITDKALGNFFHVGLIRLILPNARIIHTTRDPMDTCVSCFSKFFTGLPFSYDLAELGCYYRCYHELMAHWRSVLPVDGMLDVSYEDVVDNLEEQARRLIDYCGLPWDDRCLSFHKTSRQISTPSNVQVRRPLYRNSLGRWRRYEAYLRPLLAELEGSRQARVTAAHSSLSRFAVHGLRGPAA